MTDKYAFWNWLILIALVCGSVLLVIPVKEKVRLGLDLKGGMSFTVSIDEKRVREEIRGREENQTEEQVNAEVSKVLSGSQDRVLEILRNRIDGLGIAEPLIYAEKQNRIVIQLPGIDASKQADAEKSIKSAAFLEFRMVHEKNADLVEKLFEKNALPEGYKAARVGNDNVLVKTSEVVTASALSSSQFKEVLRKADLPVRNYDVLLEKEKKEGQPVYRPYFVERVRRDQSLNGQYLKSAAVDYQELGQAVVALEFDSRGTKMFSQITSDYAPGGSKNQDVNKHRQLAIVLDDSVYSAPVIRERIPGGKAVISGSFTPQDAQFLANILKAGSLPAPVQIEERRVVAPSLGSDSIRSGLKACVVGSIGVMLFMAAYYLLAGIVANVAVVLNMVLLPLGAIVTAGFLGTLVPGAATGAVQLPVLTLPGIAGILLTVGMAVDANVLIFERIREESRLGKGLWASITSGYDRAFLAIFDSNLTTVLTGVILFIFGSGPVRGFAVTLCAGLIVSMYTALVVTKLLFGVYAKYSKQKSLKMVQLMKETKIDFVGLRKPAIAASLILIVSTSVLFGMKAMRSPGLVFGVDFTGGSSVTFSYEKRAPVAAVRDALDALGLKEVTIQYQEEIGDLGKKYLQIKTGSDLIGGVRPADLVKERVPQAFADSAFKVVGEDDVGPQVGSELKKKAVWSIVLSWGMIIVYLAWRFKFGFALGAVVALMHDVLVTAGVMTLMGRQMSLTVVAALLTIIGFSVNDTIVIFDRIRENLRSVKNKTFVEICNLSVNQTMSRTILTSLTVFIAVIALLLIGGGAVNDFALTLFIGIITGTYSTVFIATPVVLWWHNGRRPDLGTAD